MSTRSFITLFLVSLLLFQVTEDVMLRLWYQFNNESFTEAFCENIDEPQLECKGSCFLDTQLEENTNKQALSLNLIQVPSIEIFIIPDLFKFELPSLFDRDKLINPYSFSLKEWVLFLKLPPPQFRVNF